MHRTCYTHTHTHTQTHSKLARKYSQPTTKQERNLSKNLSENTHATNENMDPKSIWRGPGESATFDAPVAAVVLREARALHQEVEALLPYYGLYIWGQLLPQFTAKPNPETLCTFSLPCPPPPPFLFTTVLYQWNLSYRELGLPSWGKPAVTVMLPNLGYMLGVLAFP